MTTDETIEFHLLQRLALGPVGSQRTMSESLGVSLGKVNYVVRALVARGLVTMETVGRQPRRIGYAYLLTPKGLAEKTKLARRCLQRKMVDQARLQSEIEALAKEAGVTDIRALAG